MEGLRYVDLFATKGIEYVIVVGFLATLVLFWRILESSSRRAGRERSARNGEGRSLWFDLDRGRLYHPGHTWAKMASDGKVLVGVDDFAQKLLGKVDSLKLPLPGERVDQGGRGLRVQIGDAGLDLLSPVSGRVVAVNEDVLRDPSVINRDPYGEGWLLKVEVDDPNRNARNLLYGKSAGAWMEATVSSLIDSVSGRLGVVLQDGGIPVSGIARSVAGADWSAFASSFLSPQPDADRRDAAGR